MDKIILIVLLISVPLLIFYAFNSWTLYKILKRPLRNDNLNDAKYFELKYKQEFFTGMFLVVVSTASILGYNFIQDIKKTTKNEMNKELIGIRDSIMTYKNNIAQMYQLTKNDLEEIENSANNYKEMISILVRQQQKAITNYKSSKDSLISLTNQIRNTEKLIKELNSKPIFEKDIYIVNGGIYKPDLTNRHRFYFANL